MKRALIFGANGQDGFYLKELLEYENYQVFGVSRKGNWEIGDVADYNFVKETLVSYKPDLIFHLAAHSSSHHKYILENHRTINTGTLNILETVYKNKLKCKTFISGSGLQFINSNLPISENSEFSFSNAYGTLRNQSVHTARYYRSLGLQIYVGYFFNHESERRGDKHLTKKIANYVNELVQEDSSPLVIGDLSVRKEYTHAKDVMEAIWILMNQDEIYEAVIGSGKAYSIQEWIKICFDIKGLNWEDYVKEDSNFSSEYKILVSNPTLIKSLGWSPKINIDALARLMIKN